MQPKLLRVLEDKEFERVGGTKIVRSVFRLIAATNQNLEKMLTDGRFRKDLFYRLNVIPLPIPPLRERREDIVPLAKHLLEQMTEEISTPSVHLDPEAGEALCRYDWPGNIRELSNVLERVLSSLEGGGIRLTDLPFHICRGRKNTSRPGVQSIKTAQKNAEREAILGALKRTRNNKAQAARLLGIHRTHLYKKIKKYGIINPVDGRM
jgi:transcriptional regulator with PAS, ATPase and Fis domain